MGSETDGFKSALDTALSDGGRSVARPAETRAPDLDFDLVTAARVSGRAIAGAPRATIEHVIDDIQHKPVDVLARAGAAFAVGAIGTVMMKNPKMAAAFAAPFIGVELAKTTVATGTYINEAGRAKGQDAEDRMAQVGRDALGRSGANLIESTPGVIAGGVFASRFAGTPQIYTRIGDKISQNVLLPVKDRAAFIGPGSEKLASSLSVGESRLNVDALGRLLSSKHDYKGLEVGRTLDISSMRLSRTIKGTADDIGYLPASVKPDKIPFHVHGPDAPVGVRPSLSDLSATNNLGIIKQGDKMAFYVGNSNEYAAMARTGTSQHFSPELRSIIIDNKAREAVRLTGQFSPGQGLTSTSAQRLDFDKTIQTLSRLDMTQVWAEFKAIPGI